MVSSPSSCVCLFKLLAMEFILRTELTHLSKIWGRTFIFPLATQARTAMDTGMTPALAIPYDSIFNFGFVELVPDQFKDPKQCIRTNLKHLSIVLHMSTITFGTHSNKSKKLRCSLNSNFLHSPHEHSESPST